MLAALTALSSSTSSTVRLSGMILLPKRYPAESASTEAAGQGIKRGALSAGAGGLLYADAGHFLFGHQHGFGVIGFFIRLVVEVAVHAIDIQSAFPFGDDDGGDTIADQVGQST